MSFSAFRRLHVIAGIFVAPLIVVAAFSGFFYALAPTIEKGIYHEKLTATSNQPAHALNEQIAAARTVHPELPIKGIQVPGDMTPGEVGSTTTRVLFADEQLESESYTHAVFVDPGDLSIKGDLIQYGSSGALPFRTWLSNGHRNLWLGETGRIYSETAASWLGPLAVSGVLVWFFHRRRTTAQRSTRKPARGTRRLAMARHSAIGLVVTPGLIFLCVSGLTWSLFAGENIAQLREKLSWMPPTPETTISATATPGAPSNNLKHGDHDGHGGYADHHGHGHDAENNPDSATAPAAAFDAQSDLVLSTARAGGLSGLMELTPPKETGTAWTAFESRQPYRLLNDSLAIDGTKGTVTDSVPFSSWPLAAQATAWIIQLHMGTLFGLWTQIALALLAVAILALVVYGYVMWFKRGRDRSFGSLPAPINWRELPVWARVILPLCVVAYALVAPLFGVSLFLFVSADLLFRLVRRQQDRAEA